MTESQQRMMRWLQRQGLDRPARAVSPYPSTPTARTVSQRSQLRPKPRLSLAARNNKPHTSCCGACYIPERVIIRKVHEVLQPCSNIRLGRIGGGKDAIAGSSFSTGAREFIVHRSNIGNRFYMCHNESRCQGVLFI